MKMWQLFMLFAVIYAAPGFNTNERRVAALVCIVLATLFGAFNE